MPQERKGSFTTKRGKLYARLTWIDEASGKRKELYKQAANRTEGKRWMKEQLRQLDDHGTELIDAQKLSFAALVERYITEHVHEAEIVSGRKVAGLKSTKPVLTCLTALREHFGRKAVQGITHADLLKYKRERLKTATLRGTQRSITTVNRELQQMRAVLNFAIRQGWLIKNPFQVGGTAPLISSADEVRRDRILTPDEEGRLLEACTGRREHLRAIVIAAMDSAARRGELLKLRWRAVDFDNRVIVLEHGTTKTAKQRIIPITRRLEMELRRLWSEAADKSPDAHVFTIGGQSLSEFKRSFRTACQLAGITGLTFHDLRHCATTKMVNAGLPAEHIMAATGHTQSSTFRRYIRTDVERVQSLGDALDAMQQAKEEAAATSVSNFIN